jgi:sigma-B regulation protein RsbU (phosphoserine phosphatase)
MVSNLSSNVNEYKIKVLLVDDQSIVGESVRRMLIGEKDVEFIFCQDPTKALQTAIDISPTIILQDLVMPDIDGLTLVKFYRANSKLKDIPLIVLSSKEEAVTKAEAFALGANDYLVKLPDKIELIARIRYHSRGYINLLERNDAYEALLKSQNILAAELSQAADYVVSLLPERVITGNIKTIWKYVPSTQLGGDSFGYHWIDSDNFAMYLLDVCDHGVGPALLSVSALNVLRTQTLPNIDFRNPNEVLAGMNETFQMSKHNNLYFTMWYGVYNQKLNELSFGSAGHPPALVLSSANNITEVFTKNIIIGAMPKFNYSSDKIKVYPPSRIYIFSDGVYEIQKDNGEMGSLEELEDFIVNYSEDREQEIETLYSNVYKMHNNQTLDDDFSMLRIDIGF